MDERDLDVADIVARGNSEYKTIYRVLNDEHEPHISTILYLAKGLGIHPKELYDFDFPIEVLDPKNRRDSDSEQSDKPSDL